MLGLGKRRKKNKKLKAKVKLIEAFWFSDKTLRECDHI